jgi:hypothetical protein
MGTGNGIFQLPAPVVGKLELAGPWGPAIVHARLTVPLREFLAVMAAVDSNDAVTLAPILRTWATDFLVDWNIHDEDGQPVPATAEGFGMLPFIGAIGMVTAWLSAASEVDLPLGQGSPDTVTSDGSRAKPRQRS